MRGYFVLPTSPSCRVIVGDAVMARDWRNDADYEYIQDLDAAGLAWECLRRNPAYRGAFPNMTDRDAFAWGLRFPG